MPAASDLFKAQRPPAGVTIDETRVARTSGSAPASCVRIRCEYAEVCLPTALLEDLCSAAPAQWRTEEERLALIASGRAKKLLAAAARQQPLIAPLPSELGHIVVLLLENDFAYVRHAIDEAVIPEIEIRYVGQRFAPTAGFGRIIVSERHVGLPLLTCDWWVA
jgi:hypothetical protein